METGNRANGRREAGPGAVRTGLWFGLFVLTGLIARSTVPQGEVTALVWPAAGVAALWIGTASRRAVPYDVLGLLLGTVAVNAPTGATWSQIPALAAGNLVGAAVFVALARRHLAHVWGLGGRQSLGTLPGLGWLVVSATAAGCAAALVGTSALHADTGAADFQEFLIWWTRTGVGTIVVVLLATLLVQPVATARPGQRLSKVSRAVRRGSPGRIGEALTLAAVTAGLVALVVGNTQVDTLTYLLVLTSVWAGTRFPPAIAALHGAVLGHAVLISTLINGHPFSDVVDPQQRAILASGFLVVTMLTGLILAFARRDLDRAGQALVTAQEEADAHIGLLDAILASMREGLVVVDERGQVLLRNPAATNLLGFEQDAGYLSPAEAVRYLYHPDGRPLRAEDLPGQRALAGKEAAGAEFHVRAPSVEHGRIVELSAQLLPDGDSDTRRAMVNIRDVTADRQHRDALANFAGTVAHDLYTPLTTINGWAETLVDSVESGELDPDLCEMAASRIHQSAQHMRDVIRDLLAYTVARDQSLQLSQVDLSSLIGELADLLRDARPAPEITVQPGIFVRADLPLIRQLFENLIGNAIKYVDPGVTPRIAVSASATDDHIEVRVTDNGIGIAPAERQHVFSPYHRIDATGHGTGLGLAICRRIVDRHGGTIRVEDGPDGRGTSMVLELPAAWDQPASTAEPLAAAHIAN